MCWIYSHFLKKGLSETEIAAELNERGLLTDLGRAWTRATVHQILTNEKYIGNNVYNRRSFKLKRKRVANGPEMWIRSDGAFDAIVEPKQFQKAQAIIAASSEAQASQRSPSLIRCCQKENAGPAKPRPQSMNQEWH